MIPGFIGIFACVAGGIALYDAAQAFGQSMNSGLVAEGATLRKLAGGFAFTEGPTPDAEGNIYFSDIPNNRIHKWSVDGRCRRCGRILGARTACCSTPRATCSRAKGRRSGSRR